MHRRWTPLSAEPRSALSAFGRPLPFLYRGPVHHPPNTMVADSPHHPPAEVSLQVSLSSATLPCHPRRKMVLWYRCLCVPSPWWYCRNSLKEEGGWMVCLLGNKKNTCNQYLLVVSQISRLDIIFHIQSCLPMCFSCSTNLFSFLNNLLQRSCILAHVVLCVAETQTSLPPVHSGRA